MSRIPVTAAFLSFLSCAALAASSGAATIADSAAALTRAREVSGWVSAGDAARIWADMTPGMRTAMKDSATFASMTAGIAGQLGALDSVSMERVTSGPGAWLYRASAHFAKVPDALMLIVSLDTDGRVSGLSVRPGERPKEYPSQFLDYSARTVLRLPFEAEWFVFWGGRTLEQNHHAGIRSQRFALDLAIRREGSTHEGEGKALTDYHCYGAPILAPAAGTVVWSEDGHPDQAIGSTDAAHPIGNGVVLDHGNGEFSLFAHLQPGTQRFKLGQRVAADAVIGKCGNSGNTSEPHLHYQLQNGPDPVDSDGLPAAFTDHMVDGTPVARGELLRGQQVRRAPAKTRR